MKYKWSLQSWLGALDHCPSSKCRQRQEGAFPSPQYIQKANTKCVYVPCQDTREKVALYTLMGLWNRAIIMHYTIEIPHKYKHECIMWFSFPLLYMFTNEIIMCSSYLYPHVYNSSIPNTSGMEQSRCPQTDDFTMYLQMDRHR